MKGCDGGGGRDDGLASPSVARTCCPAFSAKRQRSDAEELRRSSILARRRRRCSKAWRSSPFTRLPPPPSTSQERDRVALNPKTIFAATSLAAPAAAPVQMDQSYWSISDILADATKIPCHFKIDVPGVAHLRGDPSVQAQQEQASQSSSLSKSSASSRQQYEEEGMITKGTRVELPYWLAEWLVLQDCVDVSLPKPYSQRVRNALNAGPKSVQLRGQANWWYAMGSRLGGLMDSEMIMELLSSVSCGTLCRHMGDD